MRKIWIFCFCLLALSCDDGDLQIEALDFNSVDPQTCDSPITTETTLFFKLNSDEALILTLQSGLLKNEVTTENITSAIPDQSELSYRIFSDNVTKDYFCSAIPLTEPTVVENINATAGEVIISTVLKEDGNFEHNIQLSNITLETEEDQRITQLTIDDFGKITTVAN